MPLIFPCQLEDYHKTPSSVSIPATYMAPLTRSLPGGGLRTRLFTDVISFDSHGVPMHRLFIHILQSRKLRHRRVKVGGSPQQAKGRLFDIGICH